MSIRNKITTTFAKKHFLTESVATAFQYKKDSQRKQLTSVCILSKFLPEKCGVANYSTNLYQSIRAIGDFELEVMCIDPSNITNVLRFFAKCVHRRFQIIHLQHEFLLYGRPYTGFLKMMLFLFATKVLSRKKAKLVVTMHSVPPIESLPLAFHTYGMQTLIRLQTFLASFALRALVNIPDAIIVHSSFQRDVLTHQYATNSAKVKVVPHGV
jgi:hypothetical protein